MVLGIYGLPNQDEHDMVGYTQAIATGFCGVNAAAVNSDANKGMTTIHMTHFVRRLELMPLTLGVTVDQAEVNMRNYLELEGLSCLQWT
jgi:hypothetical protein